MSDDDSMVLDVDTSALEAQADRMVLEAQQARLIRAAVRQYHEAKARADDVSEKIGEPSENENWTDLAVSMRLDAETNLVRAILAFEDTGSFYSSEKRVAPNRGVVVDGRLYLAIVDPDESDRPLGWENPSKIDVMLLAIVDLEKVLTIGKPAGGAL